VSLRISSATFFIRTRENLQQNQVRLLRAQDDVTTGKRIRHASDDPSGAARVLARRRNEAGVARLLDHVADARDRIEPASAALQQVLDLLSEVEVQILDAVNATRSAQDRRSLAGTIQQALEQAISLANSSVEGRYLFGGTRTDAAPYERVPAGTTERIVYRGAAAAREIEIADGAFLAVDPPGESIFGAPGRGATNFQTRTGAVPSSQGTDTGTGASILRVRHTSTTYGDGLLGGDGDSVSGVRPGASSAAKDTIVAPPGAHTLRLVVAADGSSGSVSLDGGPATSFVAGAADVRVESPAGDVVFLDLTGAIAGFDGTVSIAAAGDITTDDGSGAVPITFTAGQVFVDPATGTRTHLDTTGVARTGRITVSNSGTQSLFDALVLLRDTLRQAGSRPDAETADLLSAGLDDVQRVREQVILAASELGFRGSILEATRTRLEDVQAGIRAARARDEEIDLAEAIARLRQEEVSLEAGLALTARLFDLTLLNFLR
jgi:flagellin-like hook-associated protein FlgL